LSEQSPGMMREASQAATSGILFLNVKEKKLLQFFKRLAVP